MTIWRRGAVALVAVGLLASGCSAGAAGPTAPVATASAGEDAEAVRLATLTDEAREEAVNALAGELWAGVIGGDVGTTLTSGQRQALDAGLAELAGRARSLESLGEGRPAGFTAPPEPAPAEQRAARLPARAAEPLSVRRHPDALRSDPVPVRADPLAVVSIGALMIGYVEVGLASSGIVTASNDGSSGTATLADGSTTATGDRARVSFSSSHVKELQGVRLQLANTAQLAPCPAPDGSFEASARIDARLTAGGAGGRAEVDVKVRGTIDDDARIVAVDSEIRVQMADFVEGQSGAFLDLTAGYRSSSFGASGAVPASVVGTGATINRSAGRFLTADLATAYVKSGALFGQMVALELTQAARSGWESGRCVDLNPSTSPAGRRGLTPSTAVTITADPRSRIDGAATGGTVVATLTEGQQSVDPAGAKVPAPASFTYLAPAAVRKAADVGLEARSRRGVAKASLHFDTYPAGYRASGGGNGLVVTGQVELVTEPFELDGTFPGGSATFTYTPTSDAAGTVSYRGGGSGAIVTGQGTYTLAGEPGGPLTLTQTTSGCADIGGCRTQTEVITLTPLP